MKTVEAWFAEYGESHQDKLNKLFHWICIPLIMFSLLGLLSEVPLVVTRWTPLLNLAAVVIVFALLFYYRLSWRLALGMTLITAAMLAATIFLRRLNLAPLWQICLGLFVLGWVGQFIGHRIEGEKPSFFKDLQFLLIGPLWLLADVYRRAGISY